MKNKALLTGLIVIAAFWAVPAFSHKANSCVDVLVDFGSLKSNQKIISCVDTDHKESALVILDKAGFNIEGTKKYGLQIVCRVNSLPNFHQEPCDTMPPENAYWAVIIKQNLSAISVKKDWNWAQTGISDVYLEPGDSLGLVFVKNEEMRWPG